MSIADHTPRGRSGHTRSPERHYLLDAAKEAWSLALERGSEWGYRNAQATCIAPTGTIGLLMDCDTTGIEPVYSQLATKRLAGGGTMTIANRSVEPALVSLRYGEKERTEILEHLAKRKTLRGAPHLEAKDLAVFATANELSPEAHLRMVAASQPFISGAISKTVNMRQDTTPREIGDAYLLAWKLGLKAVAIYRDGSKGAQVLESLKETDYEPPACPSCSDGVCEVERLPEKRDDFFAVPAALRKLPFVAYGADKIPLDPRTGQAASVTRPETWGSWAEVLEFLERESRAKGPGLVLTPDARVVCIDLDEVIVPGERVEPFAEELVERFGTYTETSLGKRGLHILFSLDAAPDFPGGRWRWESSHGEHTLEIYHASRYIALTGKIWKFGGAGENLEERGGELRKLLSECEPVSRGRKVRAGHPVNTDAMLELFSSLGVGHAVDTKRKLLHCFLPDHDDRNPSLNIDPERGWYCFGCRTGGGAVRLRELIREFTDEELERVHEKTGAPLSRLLALRERLRRKGLPGADVSTQAEPR